MALIPNSPAVVFIEKDNSSYPPNLDSSIVGIVGYATKGPTNEPTLVTNQENLLDIFGPPSDILVGQGLAGALEILETTNQVRYVRAINDNANEATNKLAFGVCPAIQFAASSFGLTTSLYLNITAGDSDGNVIIENKKYAIPSDANNVAAGLTQAKVLEKIFGTSFTKRDYLSIFSNDSTLDTGYLVLTIPGKKSYLSVSAYSNATYTTLLSNPFDIIDLASQKIPGSERPPALDATGIYPMYLLFGDSLSNGDGGVSSVSISGVYKPIRDFSGISNFNMFQPSAAGFGINGRNKLTQFSANPNLVSAYPGVNSIIFNIPSLAPVSPIGLEAGIGLSAVKYHKTQAGEEKPVGIVKLGIGGAVIASKTITDSGGNINSLATTSVNFPRSAAYLSPYLSATWGTPILLRSLVMPTEEYLGSFSETQKGSDTNTAGGIYWHLLSWCYSATLEAFTSQKKPYFYGIVACGGTNNASNLQVGGTNETSTDMGLRVAEETRITLEQIRLNLLFLNSTYGNSGGQASSMPIAYIPPWTYTFTGNYHGSSLDTIPYTGVASEPVIPSNNNNASSANNNQKTYYDELRPYFYNKLKESNNIFIIDPSSLYSTAIADGPIKMYTGVFDFGGVRRSDFLHWNMETNLRLGTSAINRIILTHQTREASYNSGDVIAVGGTGTSYGSHIPLDSLSFDIKSKYPGTGYNLKLNKETGRTVGVSVETMSEGRADVSEITVNNEGVNIEKYDVSLLDNTNFIDKLITNSSLTTKSKYILGDLTNLEETIDNLTPLNNFCDNISNLGITRVVLEDHTGLTYHSTNPKFVKLETGITYNLSGGTDGTMDTNTTLIGNGAKHSGLYALDDDTLNIGLVVIPGISDQSTQNALITLAETSQNFVAVISPPFGVGDVESATEWMNGKGHGRTASINSSWVAVYWPWLQVFNVFEGKDLWYDPAIFAVRQMAFTDSVAESWFAPAGFRRGRLTKATNTEYQLNQGDRDIIYDTNINPIVNFVPDGITIFGQKTAQRAATSLDRINVRRLMIFIRKVLLETGRIDLFEPNDEFTWEIVRDKAESFLSDIQSRRGITDFKVICDATTNTPLRVDRNELWCKILIKPTKVAEWIIFEVNLTNQSAKFNG